LPDARMLTRKSGVWRKKGKSELENTEKNKTIIKEIVIDELAGN
jgi:hypothetical protein